jgi:hypothetical protein
MQWLENAKKNLLPLSREKQHLKYALKEWDYRGKWEDYESCEATCQLCEQEELRYHFEITNKYTGKRLLVGSKCITRFGGVNVYDEYDRLISDPVEAEKRVKRDVQKIISVAKERSVMESLSTLAKKDNHPEIDIQDLISYYRERGAFTPNQLAMLIWRFEVTKVPYNTAYFKMIATRKREKSQLLKMPDWKLQKLAPCLTPSQRKLLLEHGRL